MEEFPGKANLIENDYVPPVMETIRFWITSSLSVIFVLLCWIAAFKLYRTSRQGFTFDQLMVGAESIRVSFYISHI